MSELKGIGRELVTLPHQFQRFRVALAGLLIRLARVIDKKNGSNEIETNEYRHHELDHIRVRPFVGAMFFVLGWVLAVLGYYVMGYGGIWLLAGGICLLLMLIPFAYSFLYFTGGP
jgi:hypothetical protein